MSKHDEVDKNYMVLAPSAWPNFTPGSVAILADCGHSCYISASGQVALADDPDLYETMCVPCLRAVQAADDEPLAFGEIPGARQQLKEVFGMTDEETDASIQKVFDQLRNPRG